MSYKPFAVFTAALATSYISPKAVIGATAGFKRNNLFNWFNPLLSSNTLSNEADYSASCSRFLRL